jgi:hypothetical protein
MRQPKGLNRRDANLAVDRSIWPVQKAMDFRGFVGAFTLLKGGNEYENNDV